MPARSRLLVDLLLALERPQGLARAALLLSRIESPDFAIEPGLAMLTELSHRAVEAVASAGVSIRARLSAINHLLFDVEGFRGDREHYDDVRNSLLGIVLERRRGIPISLAVVYLTVARAAGIEIMGVAFPGHFLMRAAPDAGDERPLILDPFDGGREMNTIELELLLARYAGEEARLEPGLLLPCDSEQIIVRMLNNMKRLYVGARSFPQAWQVTDLLVRLERRQPEDVRDRGLLAYHLDDFAPALADLQDYLAMQPHAGPDSDERRQIREHVSALRRRVAGLN